MNLFGQMGVSGGASAPAASIRRVPISFNELLCASILATSVSCAAAATPSAAQAAIQGSQYETKEEQAARLKRPMFLASERMTITPPPSDVTIGTPLDITITMAPGKLVSNNLAGSLFYVIQRGPSGEFVQRGSGPAKIVRDDGATKVIEVIPMQLGPVTFELSTWYSDNAFARNSVQVNVHPTAKNLRAFGLGYAGELSLVLDDPNHHETVPFVGSTPPGARWLRPELVYGGEHPLRIYADGADAILLTVEQPADAPVIRLDKNGLVHPFRVGKAVIVGDIEGVQSRLNVTVYATQDDVPNPLRPRPAKAPQMGVSGGASAPVANVVQFQDVARTSVAQSAAPALPARRYQDKPGTIVNGMRLVDSAKMTISSAESEVPIASPFDITVTLPFSSSDTLLTVVERGPSGEGIEQGSGKAKIVQEEGAAKVIEVLPTQIGKLTYEISAVNFEDGIEMVKSFPVYVYPVAKGLKDFSLGVGKRLDLAVDGEKQGERWLRPRLTYPNLGEIYADGAEAIKLTVDQPEDNPVIRLDKSGLIHPLRPGKATIIGDIEGVQDRVEVTVYATKDEVPKLIRTTP